MVKRYLFVGFVLAAIAVVGAAQPSHALLEIVRSDTAQQRQSSQAGPAESVTGAVLNALTDNESEQKRLEIQQRIDAKRAEVTEKLSGHRAEVCERREAAINQVLANRTATAERYLEKFQTIQDRLAKFAEAKNLEVENASALELIMSAKHDHVDAAVGIAKITTFDCSNTSATNPGQIVRGIIAEEKQLLSEYRSAVKDYADAVKAAVLKQQRTATTDDTDTRPEANGTESER